MKKLEPDQISKLALFVKNAIDLNPIEQENKDCIDNFGEIDDTIDPFEMEPWEIYLQNAVNNCSTLPSYIELGIEHSKVLDFLVDYYIPEV